MTNSSVACPRRNSPFFGLTIRHLERQVLTYPNFQNGIHPHSADILHYRWQSLDDLNVQAPSGCSSETAVGQASLIASM